MNNKTTNCALRWLLLALLIGLNPALQARELDDLTVGDGRATAVLSDGVTVSLRFLPYQSVEVVYHQPGQSNLPGLAIAPDLKASTPVLKNTAQGFTLRNGDVSVNVNANPFRLAFAYRNERITTEASGYFNTETIRGFRFQLTDDEQLYGGGQRVLGMDRRGHKMPLYNRAHYGYTTESSQMYYSLPAVLSSANYAILFDNTAKGTLDIGKSERDILQFSAVAGRRAYIVTLGDSTREVTTNVVSVTGRQPLPSRWLLGNFASRFGYHSEQQTRDVVNAFAREDMPLDAVVLDLYWFGKDVKGHMGNLQWDKDAFPSPQNMIEDFAEHDIKTVLITEPFILTTSMKYEEAQAADALAQNLDGKTKTFDFFFGNTALVDVFSKPGQAWFASHYTRLLDDGVAGFWGDLGEPELHPEDTLHIWQGRQVTADEIHNAYGHQWAKLVYQTLLDKQPDTRPFILMRSGFLGSQRYAMVPWTGDVSRSWGGLKPQVELALQMSVFGLAYTHSDLGGFAGGETFDKELYLRWLQLGEFQPVFRPHAQEDIAPEPVFHSEKVKTIARDILKRRYAMLPYNYSLMAENAQTGMPLMRPLSFYHDDNTWFAHDDSFYWGPSVLVAPVTEPGVSSWPVDLPPGIWFERSTDRQYEGGQSITVKADLATTPVFIKNGAIIPKVKAVNNTTRADFSHLDVHVWAADGLKENAFSYYEDDGVTPVNDDADRHYRIDFAVSASDDAVTVTAASHGSYATMPANRTITWHIHGLTDEPKVFSPTSESGISEVNWQPERGIVRVSQALDERTSLRLSQ